MEDQIVRTIKDSIKVMKDTWSKDLAEIRSMLHELVGNLPTKNHKLSLASYYLDGAALTWYQWLFQNKQLVDWEHFAAKVLIRFRKRHLKSQKSEYPTKTDAHKMFDKMLNNCPNVFTLAPFDDQIEMSDEDDIDLDINEIQQFHGSPQRDMSEREGIALVYPCVIARQTEKISRGQIALEMILVFDPEGGTFDVPILEDMDGVLLKISKAITNLSICNMPLSADKHDLHQLTLKVLINLISFLLYWDFSMANPLDGQNREMYNTIAQAQRLKCDVKFAILRAMYAYVHTKWLTAVELVRLVSIATAALTNSGLRSIEEQPMEHEGPTTDVITGGVACVIHLGNLESSKGTGVDLSVLKVSNSWFHSNTKAVALDSPSSLDRFAIVMSRWLHSNLEDKVHFEGGSIVVNQADSVRAYGLLEAFIWDPGPITIC
ncbi:hypothetical protein KY289_036507 [Solanum tuberosum]|nr:hypothetical protein KY289_036507 [Solanum tuberosum]